MRDVAPIGDVVTDYDRRNLLTYAELLDADRNGIGWIEGATDILGMNPATNSEIVRRCWETHLARARWITGAGLPGAIEAFGHPNLPSTGG